MTSVIIVQYNNFNLTREAIGSFIRHHGTEGYEIILADNGSKNFDKAEFQTLFPGIVILDLKENAGFGKANNMASKIAVGDILFFLNNDTVTEREFLSKVEDKFRKNREIGIIGPRLVNRDLTYQLSHGKLPTFIREFTDKIIYYFFEKKWKSAVKYFTSRYEKEQVTEWVTGAALFIKKELFVKVGGFDEKIFMYFEDKELCKKTRALKWKILYLPEVSLVHLRGGSSKGDHSSFTDQEYRKSQVYYYEKHRNSVEKVLLKLFLKFTGKFPK
ncbi:MAG: glycosyltransferase family 2 protein [Ignavibacteriaceae bacterium]